MSGVSSETKTTGRDKQIKQRHIFISADAYFHDDTWIKVGMTLWEEMNFKRDFFVGKPCSNLQGMRPVEASYFDKTRLSKLVMQNLPQVAVGMGSGLDAPAELLTSSWAASFWKEHSLRASLISHAYALNVPPEVTDYIGFWKPKATSAAAYIRTLETKLAQVQHLVARFVRATLYMDCYAGKMPDILGEDLMLHSWSEWMAQFHGDGKAIEVQVENMRLFHPSDSCSREVYIARYGWKGSQGDNMKEDDTKVMKISEDVGILDGRLTDKPSSTSSSTETKADELETIDPGTYVVSITGKRRANRSGVRTLHMVGRCFRVPGVHYDIFISKGKEIPKNEEYDRLCGSCWNERGLEEASEGDESSSTESAADSDALDDDLRETSI